MVALPKEESPVSSLIYANYKRVGDAEAPRQYLGASILGKSCERALYYDFRWATPPTFSGRMYRLFQTGHREEDGVINDLIEAGISVWARNPKTGEQWAFSVLGGHAGGHMDGITQGVPEAPKAAHVLEVKTHNTKSFQKLVTEGVQKSKPQHYAQMQIYMGWTIADWGKTNGCQRALYVAVCKDTDEIYVERVRFDQAEFDRLMQKAERVIFAKSLPPRLSDDPTYYECKFCDHHGTCHGEVVPRASCRTCAHSTVMPDGGWQCEHHGAMIPAEAQLSGCEEHRFIPPLLANWATPIDSDGGDVLYRMKSGGEFWNGAAPRGFRSREIAAAPTKSALTDPGVQEFREVFDAEIGKSLETQDE